METDVELLTAAALAANLGCWHPMTHNPPHGGAWNPLTDDGDALRLAVKLNIPIFPYDDETSTGTMGVVAKNCRSKEANTRRAIVLAAAAMVAC